jgi:hypothetical protein
MAKRGGKRPGAGRKKGVPNKVTAEVKDIAQQYGAAAIEAAAKLAGLVVGKDGEPEGQAESEQARIAALNIILDRAYGKATQLVTGEDGGPVKMEVTWREPSG